MFTVVETTCKKATCDKAAGTNELTYFSCDMDESTKHDWDIDDLPEWQAFDETLFTAKASGVSVVTEMCP